MAKNISLETLQILKIIISISPTSKALPTKWAKPLEKCLPIKCTMFCIYSMPTMPINLKNYSKKRFLNSWLKRSLEESNNFYTESSILMSESPKSTLIHATLNKSRASEKEPTKKLHPEIYKDLISSQN